MRGEEPGTQAGILSQDHTATAYTCANETQPPSQQPQTETTTEIYRKLRPESVDELKRPPRKSLISGADANLATTR
jgi:hypothetical protein